ncbi:hypothetical protein R3P38DRAFT_3268137, partial [Favolaschia claudopus]
WRGQSTGGWISGSNYHSFPRFQKLLRVDIARNHSSLLDVLAITAFYEHFCHADHGCTDSDAARIKPNTTSPHTRTTSSGKTCTSTNVDGNSFSGRYLGLLKSGSLVFKSTVWAESWAGYFDAWLEPYLCALCAGTPVSERFGGEGGVGAGE